MLRLEAHLWAITKAQPGCCAQMGLQRWLGDSISLPAAIKDRAILNYILLLGLHCLWWISGTSGAAQGPFQWNTDGHFCFSGSLRVWETSWFCDLIFSVVTSLANLPQNGTWPLPHALGNSSKSGQGGFFCMGLGREEKGGTVLTVICD